MDADPDQLSHRAKQLSKLKKAYEDLAESITTGVTKLDGHWDGDGADTYAQEFTPRVKDHLGKHIEQCDSQHDLISSLAKRLGNDQTDMYHKIQDIITTVEEVAGVVGGASLAGPEAAGFAMLAGDAYLIYKINDACEIVNQLTSDYSYEYGPKLGELTAVKAMSTESSGLSDGDLTEGGWTGK